MKFRKLLILSILPLLLTGCDINLYTPSGNDDIIQTPQQSIEGDINVINPSDYNGTITYANDNQETLSSEEVYNIGLSSTVYIISTTIDNYTYLGSGVFFSEDTGNGYAYLFTNAHLVADANNIEIVYSNYKRDKATLIGYNVLEDIAVLAVEKNNNYTIATLQTSNKLKTASEVLTIGAPASIEYNFSATKGILSKIDSPSTSVIDATYSLLLLQIDATLNQGNSGGPLFDMYGNLIGINTMKLLYDNNLNQIDDINFSIPIERAVFIANTFFENKPYERGLIGVTITDIVDLSLSERNMYNIDLDYGLYVFEVATNSASSNIIETGDIITKINKISFTNKNQFQKELFNYSKGESISLEIYKNNEYKMVTITLK